MPQNQNKKQVEAQVKLVSRKRKAVSTCSEGKGVFGCFTGGKRIKLNQKIEQLPDFVSLNKWWNVWIETKVLPWNKILCVEGFCNFYQVGDHMIPFTYFRIGFNSFFQTTSSWIFVWFWFYVQVFWRLLCARYYEGLVGELIRQRNPQSITGENCLEKRGYPSDNRKY